MNHVYQLIWNDLTATYVATPERTKSRGKRSRAAKALAVAATLGAFTQAHAAPTGGQISAGAGNINQGGAVTTIAQASQKLAINWNSFGVAVNETVNFVQPNSSAIALNRVLGTDGSQILGKINANGQVFILNPNGVLFGSGSQVNVGGLVASTLHLSDTDFLAGKYTFSGNGGSVINQGQITAADGGYVALIGNQVSNQGTIVAKLGTVALAAGNQVMLDFAGDGLLSLTVDQSAVNALVTNKGLIQADGGYALMTAHAKDALLNTVVNNEGIVQARTVENHNGVIKLLGNMDSGTVKVGGTLDASAPNGGDGGRINIFGALIEQAGVLRADSDSAYAAGNIVLRATQSTTVSGEISTNNSAGKGGNVQILGDNVTLTSTAKVGASGTAGGGTVLVGGDYQGKNAAVQNATQTTIQAGAIIKADALDNGNGGRVIIWSNDKTVYDGFISARGGVNGGDGGFVETSGKQRLFVTGSVDTLAPKGKTGTWLLDPAIFCVDDGGGQCLANTGLAATTTTSILNASLVGTTIYATAQDWAAFYTSAPWVIPATAMGTNTLNMTAPYIRFAGSIDALTHSKTFNLDINAYGTPFGALPSGGVAGVIDILPGQSIHTRGNIDLYGSKTVNIAPDLSATAQRFDIYAGDYFSYSPTTGSLALVPQADGDYWWNTLSINAPYISLGGSFAQTLTAPRLSNYCCSPNVHASAYGSSATYPTKSGVIELQSGMEWSAIGQMSLNASKTVNIAPDVKISANALSITANDYFIYSPSGEDFFFTPIPMVEPYYWGNRSINAPYVSLGGSFAFSQPSPYPYWPGGLSVYAEGTSTTYPAKNGIIEIQPGTNFGLTGNGGYLNFRAQNRIVFGSGVSITNGSSVPFLNSYLDAWGNSSFDTPVIENQGATITSGSARFSFNDWVGSPLNLNSYEVGLAPYQNWTSINGELKGRNVLLGTDTCPGAWCFSDINRYLNGSWQSVWISSGYKNLTVAGPFNARAREIGLDGSNVTINSPINLPNTDLDIAAYRWGPEARPGVLTVNQPITARAIDIEANAIVLNSTVTATNTDITRKTPITINVEEYRPYICPQSGSCVPDTPIPGSFINNAGPNALKVNGYGTWMIENHGLNNTLSLGGLPASGPYTFDQMFGIFGYPRRWEIENPEALALYQDYMSRTRFYVGPFADPLSGANAFGSAIAVVHSSAFTAVSGNRNAGEALEGNSITPSNDQGGNRGDDHGSDDSADGKGPDFTVGVDHVGGIQLSGLPLQVVAGGVNLPEGMASGRGGEKHNQQDDRRR